ncbi:TonB-dependent receptor plug domain-containing protein [Shewanella salipaludis]|uniref:TonB-dependent receptor n=1 Tax=Shewanella salipaludis TaxID=2723052 RepID=A0A972FYD3_9GAMM|nr:TonB-dependent receptor [Shewanella salipaludis]NMH65503.1 TonB-dependent receptor [Shewanella salipaludis]
MTTSSFPLSKINKLIQLGLFAMTGTCLLPAAQAAEADTQVVDQKIESISVIGTRRASRVDTDTPVPVDIVPMDQIAAKSGQLDIGQLLNFAAPSFNSNRQAGSDGSDHIDAASLRGLGPDQVLVLINGKRRHTSSLINVFGSRARGNVGTDLNTIPVVAIKRIEILRDGAAAQYGSDAIAGVINIVLKDKIGLDASVTTGQYTQGDGQSNQIALNYGFELNSDGGFFNVSGEYTTRDKTDRAPEGEHRVIGDSDVDNASLMFNAELPVDDKTTLYAFGGLNDRQGLAGAWYRAPIDERTVPEIYPNGFVPDIGTSIDDKSLAVGVRSELNDWAIDFSNTYGSNKMKYFISNTANASLGASSPTSFDAGGFQFSQNTTNIDFSRYFDGFDAIEGVNVASGLEYRKESYQIFAGEEGSWKNYQMAEFTDPDTGEVSKRPGGAQGFPGFQPSNELDRSRSNISAYVDLEFQLTADTLVTSAIRGEHYSDFGSTVNGKLSFANSSLEDIVLRGSASTGFRAPSLQQRYYNQVITDFVAGQPVDTVYESNDGKLAKALGIPSLKEEESVNLSLGMTARLGDVTLSVDAYQISIKDRVVLTGKFYSDDEDIGHILQDLNVGAAQFFTNAIDTKTRGVDLTLSHEMDLGEGSLKSFLSANYNKTEIDGQIKTAGLLQGKEVNYFDARERSFLEGGAPDTKFALSFDYELGDFSTSLRTTYFGDVSMGTWSAEGTPFDATDVPTQSYGAKFSTDLSFSYRLNDNLSFTVGGSNLFDVYPDKQDPDETETGGLYESVQMGFNGAYYYARASLSF